VLGKQKYLQNQEAMREMKANRLQKGTTIIEMDSLELEALQEMLGLVQSYNSRFKEKDRLQPRHQDFIKYLNMQLDRSKQKLMATDKLQSLKEKLKDVLHKSPEREKGIYSYYYYWDIYFNPEKDFGIKIDCRCLHLYLSIGNNNVTHLYIAPHDIMADSEYIKLDHQATIEAALKGKSYLLKYLKDQISAYMAAKSEAVNP
jgi:hypothetical protein